MTEEQLNKRLLRHACAGAALALINCAKAAVDAQDHALADRAALQAEEYRHRMEQMDQLLPKCESPSK